MPDAFVIDARDNVATVMAECPAGAPVSLRGEGELVSVTACELIRPEHKVALCEIPEGGPVIKYGMVIGSAVKVIRQGEWVHLHNCGSNYDERSNTLDGETGAPCDTRYE